MPTSKALTAGWVTADSIIEAAFVRGRSASPAARPRAEQAFGEFCSLVAEMPVRCHWHDGLMEFCAHTRRLPPGLKHLHPGGKLSVAVLDRALLDSQPHGYVQNYIMATGWGEQMQVPTGRLLLVDWLAGLRIGLVKRTTEGWLSVYDRVEEAIASGLYAIGAVEQYAPPLDFCLLPYPTMMHINGVMVSGAPTYKELPPRSIDLLHREDGPAVTWPNGEEQFFWRGIAVPPRLILAPHALTVKDVKEETNAEVRRLMLDRYPTSRYLQEAGGKKVDTGTKGELWALDDQLHPNMHGRLRLKMVRVVNSTPEPDGTYKVYWLRVPRSIMKADEGVAWTFRKTAAQYAPLQET